MPNPKWEVYENKATGIEYDLTDADAQNQLTAIKDGTGIDSFGDVETALATKVDKVTGKGLSTNDYDDTEKAKVAGAFPRSEQAVLGAKNLCPSIVITARDSTSTLDYNVNTEDNTVAVNGTAASPGWAELVDYTKLIPALTVLAGKTIIFNGGVSDSIRLILRLSETSSSGNTDYVAKGTDVSVTIPNNIANYYRASILLSVNNGTVCNNAILKPMISFDGGEHVPPALTNLQLTDAVIIKRISNSVDANTLVKEGIYLYNLELISDAASIHLPAEFNSRLARLEVKEMANTESLIQILYTNNRTYFWNRAFHNNTWTNWFKFEGTEVTPS